MREGGREGGREERKEGERERKVKLLDKILNHQNIYKKYRNLYRIKRNNFSRFKNLEILAWAKNTLCK